MSYFQTWATFNLSSVSDFNLDQINYLPNNKILDSSTLKALQTTKIKALKMTIFVFDRVENIVGKGDNAFYPFPSMFSKGVLVRVVKSHDCVAKSYLFKN